MLGFQLFLHALRMILGNFGAAVRVSLPSLVAIVVVAGLSITLFPALGMIEHPAMMETAPFSAGGVAMVFLSAVAMAVAFLWSAVAWHRFILLEEYPGATGPRWNGAAIWRYFVAGIVLGLVLVLLGVALGIVVGIASFAFGRPGGDGAMVLGAVLMFALVVVPLILVSYRLSPILPAAAVGERLSIKDAWAATRGAFWPFLILAIVTSLASWALGLPTPILMRASLVLGLIWTIAVQWVTMLFGVSILTTIYGYFVEKRNLNA